MAGRPMNKLHQDDVRKKIQASHIIKRFQAAFDGEIELSQAQINVGKTLLDKALPDLKAVEISGDSENPLQTVTKVVIEPMKA